MSIYNQKNFKYHLKNDSSPLTEADTKSNNHIVKELKKINPLLPIITEEQASEPLEIRSKWDEYWLIDPLDGTKEFLNRNNEFTVNIALIKNNVPILGVINIPVTGKTFWGSKKLGSFVISENKQQTRLMGNMNLKNNIRILSSRSHSGPEMDVIKKIKHHELILAGSSLKFCLIANGEADAYLRLGQISEWDIAAGHAIVEYAGCKMRDLNGNRIKYNLNETFIVDGFIVSQNDRILGEFHSHLRRL